MPEEEVLMRISERASSSAEHFVTFHHPESPDALPFLDLNRAKRKGQLGNLKKIKTRRTPGDYPQEITEVEIHDALPALLLLAKYHGLIDKGDERKLSEAELLAKLNGTDEGSGTTGNQPTPQE